MFKQALLAVSAAQVANAYTNSYSDCYNAANLFANTCSSQTAVWVSYWSNAVGVTL